MSLIHLTQLYYSDRTFVISWKEHWDADFRQQAFAFASEAEFETALTWIGIHLRGGLYAEIPHDDLLAFLMEYTL